MKIKFFYSQAFALIFGILFSSMCFGKTISTAVDGGDGLTCTAYLHMPPEKNDILPIIYFFQGGSGVYTTANRSFDLPVYYLTIDKPGIKPDPKDPSKLILDYDTFVKHTTDNLLLCSDNALKWAYAVTGNNASIYLNGHSEGSLIMPRLVEKEFKENSTLKDKIHAMLLEGIPMDALEEALNYQLSPEKKAQFWNAYHAHNDKKLFDMEEVGFNWVDAALQKPPLTDTFQNLLAHDQTRKIQIEIFQGLNDEAVPSASVIQFENANNKNLSKNKPALNLHARYYNSGHALNDSAMKDIRNVLKDFFYSVL